MMTLPSIEKRFFTNDKRVGTEYYVIRGHLPGPVVMITAGIHGTEVAGIHVASKCRELRIRKGVLIVVPLVNGTAYRKRVRGKPDMNRTFPRFLKDRARHTISRRIFSIAQRYQPSWCLDLHEADGLYRLNPSKWGQTIIVYPNSRTKRIASQIVTEVNRNIPPSSRKFAVRQSILPGSFRTAVGRILDCHAVTVETSMQQPKRTRVQYQTNIVQLFLNKIGVL